MFSTFIYESNTTKYFVHQMNCYKLSTPGKKLQVLWLLKIAVFVEISFVTSAFEDLNKFCQPEMACLYLMNVFFWIPSE